MTIFSTEHPEYLGHLFQFTKKDGNMAAIRIDQTEDGARLVAMDGHCMGLFYDNCFVAFQSVNIYIDKEMAKALLKGQSAWITEQENNYSLTVETKKGQKTSFELKCEKNGIYPDIDTVLVHKEKTQPSVSNINLAIDSLTKFKFGKNDVLRLYFTDPEGPVFIKNTKHDAFEGFTMPVVLED